MREKEKMLAGELYKSAHDNELIREREIAKELCYEYNLLKPGNSNEKKAILRNLLARIGEKILIEPNFWCDYGYNIFVGENFYMNHNCVLLDCAKIEFGDNCLIGPNCSFYTAGHPTDYTLRNEGLEFAKPIKVGNHVWIGGNVTVLPGVTIGDHVTIGARKRYY